MFGSVGAGLHGRVCLPSGESANRRRWANGYFFRCHGVIACHQLGKSGRFLVLRRKYARESIASSPGNDPRCHRNR